VEKVEAENLQPESKVFQVSTQGDVSALAARLRDSTNLTRRRIQELLESEPDSMLVLSRLKFEAVGCDPLLPARGLNFVEQLNQLFTYHASFQAAAWLLDKHPNRAPLILNLGTASGTDIESRDGYLAAEVFAAVDPRNNRKLGNDIARLKLRDVPLKYVFYLSPTTAGSQDEFEIGEVSVRRLRL